MKRTKTCPKCECKKLLLMTWVADSVGGGSGSHKAALAVRFEGHSFMGNVKNKEVGDLECITCSECGYTEYYCTNPKELVPDGKHITWL